MKKNITCLIMCAASCAMFAQTSGEEAGHIWIDLGLPSGIKWASTNIGANRPQDDGNYYAWGETTLKTDFRWATYSHGAGQNSLTKYSYSDGVLSLDAADDIVSCVWGGTWRMPTKEEWRELQEHCVWTWTDDYNKSGVAGYVVTAKSSDASLFCQLQVAVMRARLTRKAYMATTGRARFSKVPLIVAPLISCSSFGLVSKAIGITHVIMVLLCVVYAIPNQQQVWATRNQIASYTLLVAKSIVMSIAVSMIFTDVI